ncbi:MAG: fatty acid desaturase [Xanthomonadaceae bacterium]|nr:fatty acid desaturase [Xanthomonadaceae bacterium]MDP2185230.1 fatty acid desaturase [Xanthomonadales bacterium]MDZ4116378.1 fatty acid desaturase [Xanthomonadaceae bacterium]MDZ4378883.1 fatty acid desaturase [Xanthomonadaceae bacterium]
MSAPAMQAGLPPKSSPAETAALAEARTLVRDLFTARAGLYWFDFMTSTTIGWAAFVAAVLLPAWSVLQALAVATSIVALYRSVIFVHELAHLGPRVWPGFRLAWNLLCGGPMLVQSYTYSGVHNLHHYQQLYGTRDDGEYLPFARMRPMAVFGHWALGIVVPGFVLVRALILVPLSWLFPALAKWLWERASSLIIDPEFKRPHSKHDDPSWRWQDMYAWLCASSAATLMVLGVLPWRVLLVWYVLLTGILLLNGLRTLVAHRYRFPGERPLTLMEQFHDSVDVPGNPLLSPLWAPVGLRFHATHHLFPGMPYHNLGTAYRRLKNSLSDPTWFLQSSERNLFAGLRRLLRESIGRAQKP